MLELKHRESTPIVFDIGGALWAAESFFQAAQVIT